MSQAEDTTSREVPVQSPECQLLLRRAIDDLLDDLIIAGADKVTLLKVNRPGEKPALSRSQVRNVVNESIGTRSREAITNFIRYQMGRQGGAPWRQAAADRNAFGREVIADIEGEAGRVGVIDKATQAVCEKVIGQLQQLNLTIDAGDLQREVRAQLIRLYLGYLNRTYAYCEGMGDKDTQCWEDVKRIASREGGKQDV
jgi:hypothetical protein